MNTKAYVDALTSTGYLEGWAHDAARPGYALEVAALVQGREVGRGLANRFRWDLADAGCGIGWCAFRLRVDGAVSALRRGPLILMDVVRNSELCRTNSIQVIEDSEAYPSEITDVTGTDPTIIHSIHQLRGCGPLFDQYLTYHGPEAFVRAAYVYILGRPADVSGLETYAALLKGGELHAHGVLSALHDSDEYRAAPRLLGAPTEPGFVFAIL